MMPLRKQDNLEVSFRRALEELAKKDIERQCQLAGVTYKLTPSGEALISLSLMNEVYQICYPEGEVICRDNPRPVNLMKKVILLRYLNNAKGAGGARGSEGEEAGSAKRASARKTEGEETDDAKRAGAKEADSKETSTEEKLVGFNRLPAGSFYNPAFSQRVVKPFIDFFGKVPERLKWTAGKLGGVKIPFGDVGMRISFLPKVKISFIIWKGDDEFPPNGKILFNSHISSYLSTEGIVIASEMVFNELKKRTLRKREFLLRNTHHERRDTS